MPMYLCLFFFLYIVCAQAMHEKRSSGLNHNSRLDGFLCEDYIFKLNSSSLIQCGSLCQTNSLCKGIFFDKNSNTCTGCDLQFDEANFGMKSIGEPTLFYELRRDNRHATSTGGTGAFTKTESFTTTAFLTSTETLTTTDLSATTDSTADPFTTVDRSATTDSATTSYLSTTTDPYTTIDLSTTADSITTTYPMMNVNSSLIGEQAPQSQAQQLNHSRYWLVYDVDFSSAVEMCIAVTNSNQGHLAWVDTAEENQFLTYLVGNVRNGKSDKDKCAFLGLKGKADVPERFPNAMPQSDYFNPKTISPLYTGNTYCVVINAKGDWVRMDCKEIIAAICELELSGEMLSRA